MANKNRITTFNIAFIFMALLSVVACKPASENTQKIESKTSNVSNSSEISFKDFIGHFPEKVFSYEFSGEIFERYQSKENLIPAKYYESFICNRNFKCRSSDPLPTFWSIGKAQLNEDITMLIVHGKSDNDNDVILMIFDLKSETLIDYKLMSVNYKKEGSRSRSRIFADNTMWIQEFDDLNNSSKNLDERYYIGNDGKISVQKRK